MSLGQIGDGESATSTSTFQSGNGDGHLNGNGHLNGHLNGNGNGHLNDNEQSGAYAS